MLKKQQKRIFLDYASVTPVSKEVEREIFRVQKSAWANPSSIHSFGEEAKKELDKARLNIARILHCRAAEVFFTSGGTESLNLAILGVVKSAKKYFPNPHVLTSSIEHPAVLESIKSLLKAGEIEATFVLPNEKGVISPESIKKELKENTVLVAIQHANNEIGVIQPVSKIAKMIREFRTRNSYPETRYPYLLVDACQSVLYENVSLERFQADLLVIDGIKIYGPRGAGILAVRHGTLIEPMVFGGGQEGGLRSGTENVASAAGLSKALELGVKMREKESKRLSKIRDYAIAKILKEIPNSSLNGSLENRLPNNINICLTSHSAKVSRDKSKVDSEFLVIRLDTLGVAVSSASACNTLKLENGSYVIESLGKPECKNSSLRVTLGRETKKQDLDKFIAILKKVIP